MSSHTPISFLVLSLILLNVATSSVNGQAPKLPFRVNSDGSVDPRELYQLTKRPVKTDRITDEELEVIKSANQIEYGEGFRPTEKAKMPPRGDLYANSVLLSDGTNHTLLPKKALVCVPPFLESRVVEERVGRLIVWPKFLKENRGWLKPLEISFETAKGEQPLEPEELEVLAMGNSIVVSVLKGNPISMLPPKKKKEEAPSLTIVIGEDQEGLPDAATVATVATVAGVAGDAPMVPKDAPDGKPRLEAEDPAGETPTASAAAASRPEPVKSTSTARSGAFDRLKRSTSSK